MTKMIRIGSRDSRLAVAQAELVIAGLRRLAPDATFRLVTMKTAGDRILDQRLDAIGGKGLFVKELDQALLNGDVDLCVHSCKDLPVPGRDDLPVVAVPARGDPRDALVLPGGASDADGDKPIGTGSARRACQLARLFPDRPCRGVRGNVLTRLAKLDSGDFGALVLAAAGLRRLGLAGRISRLFPPEELLPAACQGILAVQGRAGDDHAWLAPLTDPDTLAASRAERAFVQGLGADCSSPVAAHAVVAGCGLTLSGMRVDAAGQVRYGSLHGRRDAAAEVGRRLAEHMLSENAGRKP